MKTLCLSLAVVLLTAAPAGGETPRPSLWKAEALIASPPAHEWGTSDGLVREVWYAGEPLAGTPTRVFAYLGRPASATGTTAARLPAILLIHGGGGRAFKDWARHWAERGYVALAMDTAGQGPDGSRHDQAGPSQDDTVKFRPFQDGEVGDMWTYHAVGAVLRGHGLIASLPEVDRERIAVTGISWGGYLTGIVAGVDPALKAAVPVYGCGFLGDNSVWRDRSLAAVT
jgi:cephalosporin-C deacetylase-like acetyl esterase